jgi:5'-phosphate synthase pdxT subunit
MVTIGVLALQGDVIEHLRALRACGAEACEVRAVGDLKGVDALIMPGGESTAIGKLMAWAGLHEAIKARAAEGMAVYGTCAGQILLAKEVEGGAPQGLQMMDIQVLRNAFGRQRESFEAEIPVPAIGPKPVKGVFIRAPYIGRVGPGVEILARFEGKIVMARQGRFLASSFHPELTDDHRIHQFFLSEFVVPR